MRIATHGFPVASRSSALLRASALACVVLGLPACVLEHEETTEVLGESPSILSQRAASEDLPAGFQIGKVTANGPGCPAGTFIPQVEGGSVSITFANWFLRALPSDEFIDQDLECILTIPIEVAAGVKYSLAEFTFSGTVSLRKGATATHKVWYNFLGKSGQSLPLERVFTIAQGAETFKDDYSIGHRFGGTDRDWSKCSGGSVVLRSRISLTNPSKGEGRISLLTAAMQSGATTPPDAGTPLPGDGDAPASLNLQVELKPCS